ERGDNWWWINVPTTNDFNIIIYDSSNPWYRAGEHEVTPNPTGTFHRYIVWIQLRYGSIHPSRETLLWQRFPD
ncbi:MAG: hypothetical protein FWC02_02385, partial [Firmicutes bacterium]|nr:hypothetical protein [Bacillota bacterium]